MEYQVQLDKKSIYNIDRNTLNLSIPYSYFSNLVKLNWNDIFFGIEHRYFPHQIAIEHASLELSNNIDNSPQEVLELVLLTPKEAIFPHSIHPYIDILVKNVSKEEKSNTIDKMMYVILNWGFENIKQFENPDEFLKIVYADFDYPEKLRKLAGYAPASWKNFFVYKSPCESTEERMIGHWSELLEKEKIRFGK